MKNFSIIVLTLLFALALTACPESDNGGNGNNNNGANNGGGSDDNGDNNGNNNGSTTGSTTAAGKLYAKAPPILSSDNPVNLSGTAGATIVEQAITYINANPGTYTLVMNSDVGVKGDEYILGYGDQPIRHLKTSNAKLLITGDSQMRKITLNDTGRMFTVGESGKTGISLTIGNNIIYNERQCVNIQ